MSPNKRKSYMRKLAKEGYDYNKIIDAIDALQGGISRFMTHHADRNEMKNTYENTQDFFDACRRANIPYNDILKLDKRPYLVGYLDARFKHSSFRKMSMEEAYDAEFGEGDEMRYEFHGWENALLSFPEFEGYGTYIPIYEHEEAKENNIDDEYIPFMEMFENLKTLQKKWDFNYVIAHFRKGNNVQVVMHDYTEFDENGNCRVFIIKE